MSANPVIENGGLHTFNFSTGIGQAYNFGQNDLGGGTYGMFTADANADGLIDNADRTYWSNQVGTTGYKSADFNMDGQVDNLDKNDFWQPNFGEGIILP